MVSLNYAIVLGMQNMLDRLQISLNSKVNIRFYLMFKSYENNWHYLNEI